MRIPTTYCVLDVETSGLPKEDRRGNRDWTNVHVARLAALLHNPSGSNIGTDVIVRLAEGVTISPEAHKVNGLTAEMCAGGRSLVEAIQALDLGPGSVDWLVGHNLIAFDWPCIVAQWGRDAANPDAEWRFHHDTKLLHNAWSYGLRRHEAEGLAEFYGRVQGFMQAVTPRAECSLDWCARNYLGMDPREGPHQPLEDCRICMMVFEAMRERGILRHVLRTEGRL